MDPSFEFSKIVKNHAFVIYSIQDFENRRVTRLPNIYYIKVSFIHSEGSSRCLGWLVVLNKHKQANQDDEPLPVLEAMLATFLG